MFHISLSFEIKIGRSPLSEEKRQMTFDSWRRLKEIIKNRDRAMCHYCGHFEPDGEPDHVLPLSRGGTDSIDNLVWSCRKCNMSKGNKTPDEWKGQQILTLEVVQKDSDGITIGTSILETNIDRQKFWDFIQSVLDGTSLSVHRWTGARGLFTRGEFDSLMAELEDLGYIEPGRGNRVRQLTPIGETVFERLMKDHEKENGNN